MSYFVSVTRLRLRSVRFLPGFGLHTVRSLKQVRAADGFLGGSLLPDRRRTFWTLTVWRSAEAMRSFMTTGAHHAVMPRLVDWCDEASVVHWEQPDPAAPSWAEADRRMREAGRPSRVRHPSRDHDKLAFPRPRLAAGASIRPNHNVGSPG
jgi:hypothetical protein